jgi:cytochrome c
MMPMSSRMLAFGALFMAGSGLLSAPVLADADGAALFRPCAACHMIGDGAVHRVGPHLNGLVGRPVGSAPGYAYSDVLREAGAEGDFWTQETLDRFLEAPRTYFPGTSMTYRGIRTPEDRTALISYLLSEGGAADGNIPPANVIIAPEITAILEISGDVPYGAFLSSGCTACHRDSGGDGIPSIAGLAPSVFIAGLVAYRNGTRDHQVMNMMAQRLGDEEIAALAAYFETAP